MRKDTILLMVGGLVFITPFISVPRSYKDPALFVLGTLILIIALLYRVETRRRERQRESFAHAENNPNSQEESVPQGAL